jgi:hypothetical protein
MARDLVFEYVRVSGGKAGSASVGRYLVANHALQEVKASYGSLSAFADHYSDTFELFDSGDESYDYQIVLRKEVTAYRCTDGHFFISSLESLWSRPDNFYLSRLRMYSKKFNMLRKEVHWVRDIVCNRRNLR